MATTAQAPEDINVILRDHVIGASVRGLQVLGINALKTVHPAPEVLVGRPVIDATVQSRALEITTPEYKISIELARTGSVTWLDKTDEWSPTDRKPAPTLRLLLADGSALDFAEPARTKRITASITQVP